VFCLFNHGITGVIFGVHVAFSKQKAFPFVDVVWQWRWSRAQPLTSDS
jgi:hypothetical protein